MSGEAAAVSSSASQRSGHIVVCGLGNLGYRIVDLLCRLGLEVVVITAAAREDWMREAREHGADVLVGDARDNVLLAEAGVARAAALIAATDIDLVNIEAALDARKISRDLRIVLRVFDVQLMRLLEDALAPARALGSSTLAGPILAYAARGENVIAAFEFAGRAMLMARPSGEAIAELAKAGSERVWEKHRVFLLARGEGEPRQQHAPLVIAERERYLALRGVRMARRAPRTPGRARVFRALRSAWSNAPRPLRVVFLTLLAFIGVSAFVFQFGMNLELVDAFYFVVTTVTTTGYGDISPKDAADSLKLYACLMMVVGSLTLAILHSFATDFVVSERVRAALGRLPNPRGEHVVVVGLGTVGYRTLDELALTGVEVAGVDLDPDGEFAVAIREKWPVVAGDGRLGTTLANVTTERASAVVAATADDAVNLAIGLAARRIAPHVRTVVRMFDADLAEKVAGSGLVDFALSASRTSAPTFIAAALFPGVLAAFADESELVILCEERAPEAGGPPVESRDHERVEVLAAASRDGRELARPGQSIEPGAELLVLRRVPLAVRERPGARPS